MPVFFTDLKIGMEYTRPQLAKLWGYKGEQAISRGIVTPSGIPYIILFVTEEKQSSLTQYHDKLEDGILYMEGETRHTADQRLIQAKDRGDEIHLFHRTRHHMPFTYYGDIYLIDYVLNDDNPSRFKFAVGKDIAAVEDTLRTEDEAGGDLEDDYIPETEGKRLLIKHITYERSRKNRARAIAIHGALCAACGFDFNKVYGADYARNFIEVHHYRSITELDGEVVNPETDLIPLCANCHRMAHRLRGRVLTLEEIKRLLKRD